MATSLTEYQDVSESDMHATKAEIKNYQGPPFRDCFSLKLDINRKSAMHFRNNNGQAQWQMFFLKEKSKAFAITIYEEYRSITASKTKDPRAKKASKSNSQ